jgi:hypothetical protein
MSEEMDELEIRLTRALEQAPVVAIPEDFALRVAAAVPALRTAALREISVPTLSVGNLVAGVVAVLLVAAMFVVGWWGGSRAMVWAEVGLGIEFAVLTAWLGLRPVLRSR